MTSAVGGKLIPKFRDTFKVKSKDSLRWFPGHMGTGLKDMQRKLKNVDCVIEVHDARIPLSGRYLDFKHSLSGLKPHIFILNKVDLMDFKYKRTITDRLMQQGIKHVFFTNLKIEKCNETKKILPLAIELIQNSNRFNRITEDDFAMMVIGAPNVGKSSLINRLRTENLKKSGVAKVGSIAGITRSVMTRIKISENPSVYLLDTPGILDPYVRDVYAGLKLSVVGCIQDTIVGSEVMADYLLFWFNKNKHFEYVKTLGLAQPVDNVLELMSLIAIEKKLFLKVKDFSGILLTKPNYMLAATHFIALYRKGLFGRYCLDSDIL